MSLWWQKTGQTGAAPTDDRIVKPARLETLPPLDVPFAHREYGEEIRELEAFQARRADRYIIGVDEAPGVTREMIDKQHDAIMETGGSRGDYFVPAHRKGGIILSPRSTEVDKPPVLSISWNPKPYLHPIERQTVVRSGLADPKYAVWCLACGSLFDKVNQ